MDSVLSYVSLRNDRLRARSARLKIVCVPAGLYVCESLTLASTLPGFKFKTPVMPYGTTGVFFVGLWFSTLFICFDMNMSIVLAGDAICHTWLWFNIRLLVNTKVGCKSK